MPPPNSGKGNAWSRTDVNEKWLEMTRKAARDFASRAARLDDEREAVILNIIRNAAALGKQRRDDHPRSCGRCRVHDADPVQRAVVSRRSPPPTTAAHCIPPRAAPLMARRAFERSTMRLQQVLPVEVE